jgi:hypothetical protein
MGDYYYFQTGVGIFEIIARETEAGGYMLYVDKRPLGWFTRAEEAAKEVAAQRCGWVHWDNFKQPHVPKSLDEWKQPDSEAIENG